MSLSQKHSGKILVPWFNSNEWKFVYKCVFSEEKEEQKKALDIIKIWKIRTPILSAGIEGTLILLEAILTEENVYLSPIYSLALLRFLNICAAGNEKQGTFSKTAKENDLPNWLINIRHDIAHGQNLPSLFLLKLCIDHCFKWLKFRYWEPQNSIIKDYVINEDSDSEMLINLLDLYIPFNASFFNKNTTNYDQLEMIKLRQLIAKKCKKPIESPKKILKVLEEIISEIFKNDKEKNIGKLVANILTTDKGLFNSFYEENCDKRIILNMSLKCWENIIRMLHENGYLFDLINKLYDITSDITKSRIFKITAALWILELICSLSMLKNNKKGEEEILDEISKNNYIEFRDTDFLYIKEAREFKNKVLSVPNNFVLYFLENLMKYNDNDDNYIKSMIDTVSQITSENIIADVENDIYTIKNLGIYDENAMEVENFDKNESNDENNCDWDSEIIWRKVTDTSMFKNCPLGILVHQNSFENPLLKIDS